MNASVSRADVKTIVDEALSQQTKPKKYLPKIFLSICSTVILVFFCWPEESRTQSAMRSIGFVVAHSYPDIVMVVGAFLSSILAQVLFEVGLQPFSEKILPEWIHKSLFF